MLANDLLGLVVNLLRCDVAIEAVYILLYGINFVCMIFVISISGKRVFKYAIILFHDPSDDE